MTTLLRDEWTVPTQLWAGGHWAYTARITDDMLAGMSAGALEMLKAKWEKAVYIEMKKAADAAGVPERYLRPEMSVRSEDVDGLGTTTFLFECRHPAIQWAVMDTSFHEWIADKDVQGAIRKPDVKRWQVVGHPGAYETEGQALAAAWSVTPAGGKRPEVVKR